MASGRVQILSYKKPVEADEQKTEATYENDLEAFGAVGIEETSADFSDDDLCPGDLIAFAWQVARGMVSLGLV